MVPWDLTNVRWVTSSRLLCSSHGNRALHGFWRCYKLSFPKLSDPLLMPVTKTFSAFLNMNLFHFFNCFRDAIYQYKLFFTLTKKWFFWELFTKRLLGDQKWFFGIVVNTLSGLIFLRLLLIYFGFLVKYDPEVILIAFLRLHDLLEVSSENAKSMLFWTCIYDLCTWPSQKHCISLS